MAENVTTPQSANSFRRALRVWYRKHARDLPWRRTRDPYAILVSEFMLQQTQVATVLPYFERWMQRFPDFETLAAAPESNVLHAWQGLGYYNRARNLHATSRIIVSKHGGAFPLATKLPGVGRYTANAVASFAFDAAVPVVDTNVARVLARVNNVRASIDSSAGRDAIWSVAEALVPQRGAGEFNAALMELGALVCTSRQPRCTACPVKTFCRAPDPLQLPIRQSAAPMKALSEHHCFAIRKGRVLLEQSTSRWRGMWILPRLTSVPRTNRPLHTAQFPFTNHRVTLRVFDATPRIDRQIHRWVRLDSLGNVPMPSPHRRALNALLSGNIAAKN